MPAFAGTTTVGIASLMTTVLTEPEIQSKKRLCGIER
jgi:hypothetical protein